MQWARCGLVFVTVLALLVWVIPVHSQQADPGPGMRETVEKDLKATLRFLQLKLEREKQAVLRDGDAQAARLEGECLRHEIKCLERVAWYLRHDPREAARGRAISAAVAKLRDKTVEASLQERKASGFSAHELVLNPFGVAPVKAAEATQPARQVSVSPPRPVTKSKPAAPSKPVAASRFDGVRPPEVTRPEAGSAGSAGSRSDRQ